MYSGAKNVVPDDFLELKKEAAKRGRRSTSSDSGHSVFCRTCPCSWQAFLHFSKRLIPNVLQGVALLNSVVNYNKRYSIVADDLRTRQRPPKLTMRAVIFLIFMRTFRA